MNIEKKINRLVHAAFRAGVEAGRIECGVGVSAQISPKAADAHACDLYEIKIRAYFRSGDPLPLKRVSTKILWGPGMSLDAVGVVHDVSKAVD